MDIFRPPVVAIDIGTAMTRVSFGSGVVCERPSIVRDNRGIARPVMRGGVVADIAGVATVVRTLLESRRRMLRRRPDAVVCAPTDVSPTERDALIEAVTAGGASVLTVVPEPLAAAIGAGVDIASEYANAVVDIGDGVTDLAVFRNGTIIFSDATRVGCGTLRAAIHDWAESQQGSALRDETIDGLVRAYCQSAPLSDFRRCDLEMLLEPVIEAIASFIATTIEQLPHDIAVEVIESGIQLTGGGATMPRLVACIEERTGLHVKCAEQPLSAVVRGAGEMVRNVIPWPLARFRGSSGSAHVSSCTPLR